MAVHVLSVPAMALMVPMTLASLLAMALNPVTMPFALPYMIVSGVLNWLAISGAGLLVTLLEKRPVRPPPPAGIFDRTSFPHGLSLRILSGTK